MIYYTESKAKALREAVEKQVLNWPRVTTRRMFGCPAYLVDGKLFAFLVTDGVVITQIRKRDREELEAQYSVEPFKAGEREIERWLQVTVDDLEKLERVLTMVKKSYDTVLRY
jgi:TfoX/Sxy family transcriptional regulator of competence genes